MKNGWEEEIVKGIIPEQTIEPKPSIPKAKIDVISIITRLPLFFFLF